MAVLADGGQVLQYSFVQNKGEGCEIDLWYSNTAGIKDVIQLST